MTQWGSSEPFVVEVVIAPSPKLQTFDVDAQYNSSLAAALMAVAKAKLAAGAAAEVILGPRQYAIAEHLVVPSATAIKGAGAATTLTFTLQPPKRGQSTAAFDMVSRESMWRPRANFDMWCPDD